MGVGDWGNWNFSGAPQPSGSDLVKAYAAFHPAKSNVGSQFGELKKMFLSSAQKAGMPKEGLKKLEMGPNVPGSASFSLHEMIRRQMAGGSTHGQAVDLLRRNMSGDAPPITQNPNLQAGQKFPRPDESETARIDSFNQLDHQRKHAEVVSLYQKVEKQVVPQGRHVVDPRQADYNVRVQLASLQQQGFRPDDAYVYLYQNLMHKYLNPHSGYWGP